MRKSIGIVILVILLSALALLGYLYYQSGKTIMSDPYKAVIPGSVFVIETADIKSFINSITSGQGLFGELHDIEQFKKFNTKLKYFADQINKAEYLQITNERKVIISVAAGEQGKLHIQFSAAVPGTFKKRHLYSILKTSGAGDIQEKKQGAGTVYAVPYMVETQPDTLYFSLISGLLRCSTSGILLEKSDAAITSGNDIRSLQGFTRVYMASGKKEDKIFVVFKNLLPVVNQWYSRNWQHLPRKISDLADVAAGDIFINEEGIVLSGYTESTVSDQVLNRLKRTNAEQLESYRILPASTIFFESAIRNNVLENKGKKADTGTGKELFDRISPFLDAEITKAYVDLRGRSFTENQVLIYELSDRIQAEQGFAEVTAGSDNTIFFTPDDVTRIPVYNTDISGFASMASKGFADDASELFVAFFDRFMISGSSYPVIARLLYDNLLNKTLENDLFFREFESTLPSRSGYFFYCVPSKITDILEQYLNPELISAVKENRNSINKIQGLGYQAASSNEMIYNSISISYKQQEREESRAEWETLLDTLAAVKPFFFTNHITGAREIFLQDLNNNAYLVNSAGRVLWKVPLRERMAGPVYMVDYYRNGKYQLLFSGREYLHLLDRNGNYVERFPVKLRSPATSPLSLLDYDNNLNYRLLIAGEDRYVYAYDIKGNIVRGWKPFRTAGTVRTEICYFRNAGKDYLVASDESSIYFVDRKGNKRLSVKEPVSRASGSAMRLSQGNDPSVVCSSPDGKVQHIYFDGTVKKFSPGTFSIDHSFEFFDVDGDGFGEYIFIEKGILYLYDHNRTELFRRDFETDQAGGPICFTFSAADRKIGIFDSKRKLIYLIEKNGDTAKGFPLRGASMFSIGRFSDKSGWHLIVGGTDRFLYNYRLETY